MYGACYQAGLANDPDIDGTVTVRFRVEQDGAVSEAHVEKTSLNSSVTEDCLIRVIRSWQFLPGYAADAFELDFPFTQG